MVEMFSTFLVLLCCIISIKAAIMKMCLDHKECGENKFCYATTNMCSPCVDCSSYRRMRKQDSCAKDPQECGACTDGFIEDILGDGSVRALCVPHETVTEVRPPLAVSLPSGIERADVDLWVPCVLWIVGLLVSVVLLLGFMNKNHFNVRIWSRPMHNISSGSNSAATSTQYAPSAPAPPFSISDTHDEVVSSVKYVAECVEEKSQQVSKFMEPCYVTAPPPPEPTSPGATYDAVDGPVVPSTETEDRNEPYLHDEDTLPSDWTPGPGYGEHAPSNGLSQLTTSFAGILRLNATTTASTSSTPTFLQATPASHSANSENPGSSSLPSTQSNVPVLNRSNSGAGILNTYGSYSI